MRIKNLVILIFLLTAITASAQKISSDDLKNLQGIEDTLTPYARQMIFEQEPSQRFEADSMFIRLLVRALKIPNSFYYKFDSVTTVSILYPEDSSFRIFTWQLERDEGYYRQHGAIQMRTNDGSLKLFPLLDASDYTPFPNDSVRSSNNWIGAIYYALITTEYKGKKFYTLFGYDDNNLESTRKWLDVLTFDNNNNPQFGGRYFDYPNDSLKPPQPVCRFCLEYKKDGHARMNYDPEMGMIIFDHLISETNELSKKYTLIPDGDYEGFKWQNGKWIHVDKVFTYKLENGQEPKPALIYDDNGVPNEQKLLEQSEKNKQKQPSDKKPPKEISSIDDLNNYY